VILIWLPAFNFIENLWKMIMNTNTDLTTHFAQQVIQAAGSQIPNLQPGVIYITEQILGPVYWDTLSTTPRKQAGKVLAEAVRRGLLPLTMGEPRSDNHRTYTISSKALPTAPVAETHNHQCALSTSTQE